MHARQFTHDDQLAFARLSGDWNPIHVDPIAARRLLYGEQVVHGLHLVAWVLECLSVDGQFGTLSKLTAIFRQPVLLGREVVLVSEGPERVLLEVDGVTTTELTLAFGGPAEALAFEDGSWPEAAPKDRDFPAMEQAKGALALRHDVAMAAQMLPALTQALEGGLLSLLLASTRLVGMEVPGRHSLYSELALSFDGSDGPPGQMAYEVVQSHADFRLLNTALTGQGWQGGIRSFMRPAPVAQLDMQGAQARVGGADLSGQKALIVGGSRGLGEVTARLLAAAGAEVHVSYASGQADAEALCAEIIAAGGCAEALALDVLADQPARVPGGITDLYYFAAPRIKPGPAQGFDPALFDTYLAFFVTGFAKLVAQARGPLRLIYPSTVYVAAPEKGFAEYAAAKAAGEALCRYISKTRHDIETEVLALPRMKTDQTQAIVGAAADDPSDVLWPLLDPHQRS